MCVCIDQIGSDHSRIAATVHKEAVAWNEGRYCKVIYHALGARFDNVMLLLREIGCLAITPVLIVGRLVYGLVNPKAFLTQCKIIACVVWLHLGGIIQSALGILCAELVYHLLRLHKYLVYIPYIVNHTLTSDYPEKAARHYYHIYCTNMRHISESDLLKEMRLQWPIITFKAMFAAPDGTCYIDEEQDKKHFGAIGTLTHNCHVSLAIRLQKNDPIKFEEWNADWRIKCKELKQKQQQAQQRHTRLRARAERLRVVAQEGYRSLGEIAPDQEWHP